MDENNKKGEINNPDNYNSRKNRGFYFEDYETPKYEYKDQSRFFLKSVLLNKKATGPSFIKLISINLY